MNASLKTELEKFIQLQVSTGGYASASEVVEEALLLGQEQNQFLPEDLDRELQLGVDALDAGDCAEYGENSAGDLVARIAARGRAELAGERDRGA